MFILTNGVLYNYVHPRIPETVGLNRLLCYPVSYYPMCTVRGDRERRLYFARYENSASGLLSRIFTLFQTFSLDPRLVRNWIRIYGAQK